MRNIIIIITAIFLITLSQSVSFSEDKKPEPMPFPVYLDKDTNNHYILSGWMGDVGDLAVTDWEDNVHEGKTCLKWTYSAGRSHNQGWAGCSWQDPINNWGDKKGGYNLSRAGRLTFWGRGEKGGEVVTFLMGGVLSGKVSSDTSSAKLERLRLTKDWKKYIIDLDRKDLGNIITGFGFVVTKGKNPKGCTFYLDEITYNK